MAKSVRVELGALRRFLHPCDWIFARKVSGNYSKDWALGIIKKTLAPAGSGSQSHLSRTQKKTSGSGIYCCRLASYRPRRSCPKGIRLDAQRSVKSISERSLSLYYEAK